MKFNEFQDLSKRTMPKMVMGKYDIYYDKDALTNYVMGLAGESGELIDLLKKRLYHGHRVSDLEVKKEIGDIFHYLFGLCTILGFRAEEVATLNVMKLAERYPDGFSVEDSIRRVDIGNEF